MQVFTNALTARSVKTKLIRDKLSTFDKAVLITLEEFTVAHTVNLSYNLKESFRSYQCTVKEVAVSEKKTFSFAIGTAGLLCCKVMRTCVQLTDRFSTTKKSRPTDVSRTETADTRVCHACHKPGHIAKYCPKWISKNDRQLNC